MKLQGIKLIIGLGNPGAEYAKTYHNAGFLTLDFLAKNLPKPVIMKQIPEKPFQIPNSKKFGYLKIDDLTLVKPAIFMNESGKAVLEASKYFKTKTKEILVIHDDSDIKIGKYKISFGRSSAGHKGVESIINTLKTKDFWRLRIGVRPLETARGETRKKASDFVLNKISKENSKIFEKTLSESLKTLKQLWQK